LHASASLTHARMETSGAAAFLNGLRPAQTPNVAATLSGSWEKDEKSVELQLRRVGSQFEDDLNRQVLKAATTFDASASWPIARRLQLIARAENITNALVMAAINGDGSIERATPRTLWIGLRLDRAAR
jgi:outer membrane receptor protein involved in Fe transport